MAYRQVYFRIRTDCYNSGWTSDADRTAFEKESRRLFQELGWTATLARYIAKNIVAAGLAEKCTVSLAYAIGRAESVAVDIDAHQTGKYSEAVLEQAVRAVFDLTPSGMISALELDRPIFAQFCNYGHFTHQDAPWEQTDRAAALADACQMAGAGAFTR